MDSDRIVALLEPYMEFALSPAQLGQVSTYLDLLLRWNAKMNLTSVREPEYIVSRHFGESFFLAAKLFGRGRLAAGSPASSRALEIVDVGSGAGFPGIPIKVAQPELKVTLVEAQHRKAVFLREVVRALAVDVEVKNVRAEDLPSGCADVVTLRAVEKFESILPTAAGLVRDPTESKAGLGLLIGSAQVQHAKNLLPAWRFQTEIAIPNSQNRVVQIVEPR